MCALPTVSPTFFSALSVLRDAQSSVSSASSAPFSLSSSAAAAAPPASSSSPAPPPVSASGGSRSTGGSIVPGASSPAKKRKRRAAAPPGGPKRPASAYLLFANATRPTLSDEDKHSSPYVLADRWRALDSAARKAYEERANKLMAAWKDSNRKWLALHGDQQPAHSSKAGRDDDDDDSSEDDG